MQHRTSRKATHRVGDFLCLRNRINDDSKFMTVYFRNGLQITHDPVFTIKLEIQMILKFLEIVMNTMFDSTQDFIQSFDEKGIPYACDAYGSITHTFRRFQLNGIRIAWNKDGSFDFDLLVVELSELRPV